MKYKPVCKYCGNERVLRDAYARWDYDLQEWVISSTYNSFYCDQCDGPTSLIEKTISEATK